MSRPTSVLPVKAKKRISGWSISACATFAPPCTTEIRPSGRPASISACAIRLVVLGVLLDGLTITALPAAIAGATLCATVLTGALNGVIAQITPSGTGIVKPRRPACCGAPSSGIISPTRRRASSAERRKVWMQRLSSPCESVSVKPASVRITSMNCSLRCSIRLAARSRIAPRSCAVSEARS